LDTASLLAKYHVWVSGSCEQVVDVLLFDQKITKLGLYEWVKEFIEQEDVEISADIQALADQRRQAKLDKDYSKADEIRGQLTALWWSMLDGKDWYTLEKI
jgi:cysteinyl-tRNA synthetase